MRRIQRHNTKQPGHQPRTRQRKHPPHKYKRKLPPIDRPNIVVHQRDTQRRADQALRRRHGEPQPRRQQHRDRRTQLDAEPPRRRHLRDLVAHRTHHVVPVHPEAQPEQKACDDEEPDGGGRARGNLAFFVGLVDGGPGTWEGVSLCVLGRRGREEETRTDSVGHVVGAVCDGHHHGGHDLAVSEEVFDADVVALGTGVDGAEEVGVVGYYVAGDAWGFS